MVSASGGKMGGTIALRLAAEGCDVALNDLDAALTAPYAEQIRAMGRDVLEVTGDVTEREHAEALVNGAIDRWGGVDILVNNVGGSTGPYIQDILAITDDDWDATLRLNLRHVPVQPARRSRDDRTTPRQDREHLVGVVGGKRRRPTRSPRPRSSPSHAGWPTSSARTT